MRALLAIGFALTFLTVADPARADSTKTIYTFLQGIHWIPDTTKGVPPGSYYAVLRGKDGDKCDEMVLERFPDGFVYPWHVNHEYDLYTILKGTLVIGFNEHHQKSAERALPAGSFIQGLANEPHYGRAIGETIFEVYSPCPKV
jgi:quercetin dioxygenase-like cupin family protein